jgi:hypothetical protein
MIKIVVKYLILRIFIKMSGQTYNYANCLGFSKWDYNTLNKAGSAQMTVNSITSNNINPLNLFFNHDFISKR